VRKRCATVGVPVLPPSFEILERRSGRSAEDRHAVRLRHGWTKSPPSSIFDMSSSTTIEACVEYRGHRRRARLRCAGPAAGAIGNTFDKQWQVRLMTDQRESGNKFEFVIAAEARARQLSRGCTPRTEGTDKPVRPPGKPKARSSVRGHCSAGL
jgi:hypothetical protein